VVPVGWLVQVMAADFAGATGHNPDFVGWGDEDVKFCHRLEHAGCEVKEWHRMPESLIRRFATAAANAHSSSPRGDYRNRAVQC
jgi:hypothetical protein